MKSSTMKIKINGQSHTFATEVTVAQILTELKIPREHGIAVALNGSVIPRSQFQKTQIQDGDKLEIVHATAGG